jgi:UDP-glucose 4-epimerase
VVAILAERLAAGEPVTIFGTGEQRRDFVHVSDVAEALLVMARSAKSGMWNVGTGRMTTINALLAEAEQVFGAATQVLRQPARAGDVFSSCLAVEKIARELEWRPTMTLQDGLRTLHD